MEGNLRNKTRCEGKRGKKADVWKMGTWNVRSIMGKETELVEELEKIDIDILGLTETKKKGRGEMELQGGHVLIYSGVEASQRAREGVGCIVNKRNLKHICGWESISERILTLELSMGHDMITTIIVVYGPNEDASSARKNEFWEQLTEVAERAKGRLVLVGDFNSRVGIKDCETGDVLGSHGERGVRNNNGGRLIDFCIMNNLIITNTFYEHKDIHKYTRVVESRRERSIIDYVLVNRKFRNEVKDTRVRRGAEIYSDHFLVLAKIKIREAKCRPGREVNGVAESSKTREMVRVYKLREEETARDYREKIEKEMEKIKKYLKNLSLENLWKKVRDTIISVAKESCGSRRLGGDKKRTKWWSDEIRAEIKLKKQKWGAYLGNKSERSYNDYKEQRTKVKELVKRAKQKSWEEFGEKMERDSKGNQKLFFKVLKNLRNGKQYRSKYMKAKDGRILKEDKDIIERWKEYFETILNRAQSNNRGDHEVELYEGEENEKYREQQQEIKEEEVLESIKMLKRGKAAGNDEVTAEMLQNLGRNGIEVMTYLFNLAWREEKVPKDWEMGILVPIHKKGDHRECSNYRGITILSIVSKTYERILEKRLRAVIENRLEEPQCGFRKGRGVQDHIFTLKQLIEKNVERNVFVAFIDLEKAFDSIPRNIVWNSLRRRINGKLFGTIMSLYKNTRNCVRTGNMESPEFTTKQGLRQGGILSPTLFNVVMDDIIKETKNRVKKVRVGYRNLEVVTVSVCAFADDLAILAESEKDLQENLRIWREALHDRGLKINIEKTRIMSIGREDFKMSTTLDGNRIEQTETFNYLGVRIHKNGRHEAEVNERLEKTMKLYHSINKAFIRKKEISMKAKISVYKAVYRPILTYGCESWTLTNQIKSKVQAAEMKYLRAVKGVTRLHRIRNEDIREELQVEPVLHTIEKQQLKWLGHMYRMKDERQVKRVWQARTDQRRRKGRPRKTWNDRIAECLSRRGLTWREGRRMAENKKQWAEFVHQRKEHIS